MDTRRRPQRPPQQRPHRAAADIALLAAPPPASDWQEIASLEPAGVGFLEPAPRQTSAQAIGAVDGLIGAAVFGWAYDPDFGRRRLRVTLTVNDTVVAETVANGLRRELAGTGNHDGFSGFACSIPADKFTSGAVVRVFADGIELNNSPLTLGSRQIDGALEPIKGATASGWVRERVREPTRAVLDMFVDGRLVRSVTADRLREELKAHGVDDGCFGYAEPLPASCFDGGVHEIEFRHRASGNAVAPGARAFRAGYTGALDRLDQYGGQGWVTCAETPGRPAALDIVVNGARVAVTAETPRPDIRAARGIEAVGFEFSIPGSVSRH